MYWSKYKEAVFTNLDRLTTGLGPLQQDYVNYLLIGREKPNNTNSGASKTPQQPNFEQGYMIHRFFTFPSSTATSWKNTRKCFCKPSPVTPFDCECSIKSSQSNIHNCEKKTKTELLIRYKLSIQRVPNLVINEMIYSALWWEILIRIFFYESQLMQLKCSNYLPTVQSFLTFNHYAATLC